jgi:PQQ-dependent catabolism-associated beta-propeller protein
MATRTRNLLVPAIGVTLLAAVAAGFVVMRRPAPPPGQLYVSSEQSGTVTVVNLASNTVMTTIPVGKRPRGVQVSPDRKSVYVALSGSTNVGPGVAKRDQVVDDKSADGIGVIDAEQNKLVKVLVSGSDPEQFAVSADSKRLYIANEDTGQLSVVDTQTNTLVQSVAIGSEPEGVALSPDGKTAFVASETGNRIDLIDTASNTNVGNIPVGARPRAIAISRDGARAFVTLEDAGSVVLIDIPRRKVLQTVKLPGDSVRPMGVAIAPDGRAVYVTTGRGKKLFALDPETCTDLWSVEVGDRPWGVAVSADGRRVYTANGPSNDVAVVDVETRKVISRILVAGRPWGLAIRSGSAAEAR